VASFLVPVFWRFSPGGHQAHMTTPTMSRPGSSPRPSKCSARSTRRTASSGMG